MNDLHEECNKKNKKISMMYQNSGMLRINITINITLVYKNT